MRRVFEREKRQRAYCFGWFAGFLQNGRFVRGRFSFPYPGLISVFRSDGRQRPCLSRLWATVNKS